MPDIVITLANDHGGTYIVKATATYDVGGQEQSCSRQVSGGLSATMDPIPALATNLRLDLTFVGILSSDRHGFVWNTPIAQFPDGKIIVDLSGVWPGRTAAVERTAGGAG